MFCNPEQKLQDMNLTAFQHNIPNAKTSYSNKSLYCIYPSSFQHRCDNADCNALKFEVPADGKWFILGYCGVNKIPKLKQSPVH